MFAHFSVKSNNAEFHNVGLPSVRFRFSLGILFYHLIISRLKSHSRNTVVLGIHDN